MCLEIKGSHLESFEIISLYPLINYLDRTQKLMVNTSAPHQHGQHQEFVPSQTMSMKKYYRSAQKSFPHVEEMLLYHPRKLKLMGHQNVVNMGMVCLELR